MIVDTCGPDGPWCPICHTPVSRAGEFDTVACWEHFHNVVMELFEPVEMNYLAMEEQPWYSDTHG